MSIERTYTLGRFRTRVILHILAITGLLLFETYLAITGQSLLTIGLIAIVITYLVINLFRVVNRTNRDLTNFLLSIRFDDFETTYTTRKDQGQDKESLYKAFNLITGKFRDIRSEKEAQHQLLITLVEQVETGIICFNEEGQTILMNHAVQQLLHKSYIPTMDSLKKVSLELYEALETYTIGERRLIKVEIENDILQLAFVGTIIKIGDQPLRIFSLQNIRSELEYREMESWQKLIRILTHEIMNSVSPVVSLAATTDDIIAKAEGLEEDTRQDIHNAIEAIQKRGESLLDFTSKYRQLARVPPPELEDFDFKELLNRIITLHKAETEEKQIEVMAQFPQHKVILKGDESLLEQAFINLFKNAMEALEGRPDPKLEIQVYKDGGEVITQIADNGDGIDEEMIDQIFIPFFTTKKRGSGIGLSLCRQIILSHQGTILVKSQLGKGTVFTVRI